MRLWRLGALLACFAALRAVSSVRAPSVFHDSAGYDQLSFLGHQARLWTVPLLYTLVPTNGLREAAQILVGILAWSFLSVTVGDAIGTRQVRLLAMVAVCLFGLVPVVTLWDGAMLSESLSISLTVMLLGLLIRLRAPTPRLVGATLVVTLLWVFTRQTNTLTFLALSPFAVGFTVWRLPARRAAVAALALSAIAGYGAYTIFVAEQAPPANHVWRFNSLELVTDRLALEPDALRYFVKHGMPLAPVVTAERAPVPSVRLVYSGRFGAWVQRSFRRVYLGWLEHHLPSVIGGSLRTTEQSLLMRPRQYGRVRAVLPRWLSVALWPTTPDGVAAWLVCALTLMVVGIVYHRRMKGWVVCGTAVIVATAMGSDTYLLSTEEYARLLLPTALLLRLVLLFVVLFTLDALLDARGETQTNGERTSPPRRDYEAAPYAPAVPEGAVSPAAWHPASPAAIDGGAASLGGLAKDGRRKSK